MTDEIILTGFVQEDGTVKVMGRVDMPRGSIIRLVVQPRHSVPIPQGVTLAEALKIVPKELTPEQEEELNDALMRFLSLARDDLGLPPDYPDELDHYLYGTPKRSDDVV